MRRMLGQTLWLLCWECSLAAVQVVFSPHLPQRWCAVQLSVAGMRGLPPDAATAQPAAVVAAGHQASARRALRQRDLVQLSAVAVMQASCLLVPGWHLLPLDSIVCTGTACWPASARHSSSPPALGARGEGGWAMPCAAGSMAGDGGAAQQDLSWTAWGQRRQLERRGRACDRPQFGYHASAALLAGRDAVSCRGRSPNADGLCWTGPSWNTGCSPAFACWDPSAQQQLHRGAGEAPAARSRPPGTGAAICCAGGQHTCFAVCQQQAGSGACAAARGPPGRCCCPVHAPLSAAGRQPDTAVQSGAPAEAAWSWPSA